MKAIINVTDGYGNIIGSVCHKPQGYWAAYLATDSGDQVIGQHPTQQAAEQAVQDADGERVVDEILAVFSGAGS